VEADFKRILDAASEASSVVDSFTFGDWDRWCAAAALTEANVDKAKELEPNLSGLLDRLLTDWLKVSLAKPKGKG
jgi:hypothetical protein